MFANIVDAEYGAAWFYVAPGSGLGINVSGMHIVECPGNDDPISTMDADACYRYRLYGKPLAAIEVAIKAVDSQSTCPSDIPFVVPCVDVQGMAMNESRPALARMCPENCWRPRARPQQPPLLAIACLVGILAHLLRETTDFSALAIGAAIWLPANAIYDELPVLVKAYGAGMAPGVIITTQIGAVGGVLGSLGEACTRCCDGLFAERPTDAGASSSMPEHEHERTKGDDDSLDDSFKSVLNFRFRDRIEQNATREA